jgi:spermidine synthase
MYKIIKNIFRINREEVFGEIAESVTTIQDVKLEFKEKHPEWIVNPGKEGFEVRYYINKQLYAGVSNYQKIDIIENENFGRMMFLDNDAQIAESDGYLYNEAMVAPLVKKKGMRDIAILGGGDGGVAAEVLKLKPKQITIVEIDEAVIRAAKEFFPNFHKNVFANKKVKVVIDDVYKFLDETHTYDAILYDLTMRPGEFMNIDSNTFLDTVFGKIKKNLRKKGIVSLQCASEFDTETLRAAHKLLKKHFIILNLSKHEN